MYNELRDQLDRLSFFAGKNPLVSGYMYVCVQCTDNVVFLCIQEVAELKEKDLLIDNDLPSVYIGFSETPMISMCGHTTHVINYMWFIMSTSITG